MVSIPGDEICPSCGERMEKGWIAANMQVYWNVKRPSWSGKSSGAERMDKGFWAPGKIAAYRCKDCRVIRYYPAEFDWET